MSYPVYRVPGKRHFRVVATLCEVGEPCCIYTVAAEIWNVDDECEAVEEFCETNCSTCLHSCDYILTDYYTEEML